MDEWRSQAAFSLILHNLPHASFSMKRIEGAARLPGAGLER